MKLAIMQPYLLPYIGYWQLLAAVDKFVVLDDVAFIPRGWIHRNRILVNGAPYLFTLPVSGSSPNRLIYEIERADSESWRHKFHSTLRQSYGHAPHYKTTMALLDPILTNPERNLSRFILDSLQTVAEYLEITTHLALASSSYDKHGLKGQERIIDICKREGTNCYLNSSGGILLYERDRFAEKNIFLQFLEPNETPYPQRTESFVPWLSIIDLLMNVGRDNTRIMLADFTLS